MQLVELATRPMGVVFGSGRLHGWNQQAQSVLRRYPDASPWTDEAWQRACRRTVRMAANQDFMARDFRLRASCVDAPSNCGRFVQAAYATQVLLVEILQAPPLAAGSGKSLAGQLGLTGSEVAILRELGFGTAVNEIALQRRTSPATIRQHLKNIRRKTGMTRMPALVRFAAEQLA
jgi:DNA-binding NarL/FixJ family response regulator